MMGLGTDTSGESVREAQAELAACEKGLKEGIAAASFELEQQLWGSGLRGDHLQARLRSEVDTLRSEWRARRARAEAKLEEEERKRSAERTGLAAYVQRSMLNSATHTLSRLVDVGVAAGGERDTAPDVRTGEPDARRVHVGPHRPGRRMARAAGGKG